MQRKGTRGQGQRKPYNLQSMGKNNDMWVARPNEKEGGERGGEDEIRKEWKCFSGVGERKGETGMRETVTQC